MPYTKTSWKDRVVEKPMTFTMQNNPDGTITLIPAEGQIIEVGTPLTADNMNNLENQYETALKDIKTGVQVFQGPLSVTNQPYVESNKTAQSTIQPRTWTKIQNPARVNRGGGTWSSTGDYTVPSDGVYECVLVAYMDGLVAGDGLYTAVYYNGQLGDQHRLDQRQSSGTQDGISVGSTIMNCVTGDVFNFWIYHSAATAKQLMYAHMKVTKIS